MLLRVLISLSLLLEYQSSPEVFSQWICNRVVDIDTKTGLLPLSLDLTRRVIESSFSHVDPNLQAPLIEIENKADLLQLYLSHSQEIDNGVELLDDDDDVTTLSLETWIALSPLDLLSRLIQVNSGDIADLARSLTQTDKLTHSQIQGYLCQCDKVDAFVNYCTYYVEEILPSDPQSNALEFANFVISMCFSNTTTTTTTTTTQPSSFWNHQIDLIPTILPSINQLSSNVFILNNPPLLATLQLCQQSLSCLQITLPLLHRKPSSTSSASSIPTLLSGEFSINSLKKMTATTVRQWLEEDAHWLSEALMDDMKCESMELSELLTLLQRPSIRFLQSVAFISLQHTSISATITLLEKLINLVFSFLPADILSHLLLSVLLHVGSGEALNTIHRLTNQMKREFVQSTVLQNVCDMVLSMHE